VFSEEGLQCWKAKRRRIGLSVFSFIGASPTPPADPHSFACPQLDGLRLPYDIIGLIAELLASESDDGFDNKANVALDALNCLNRTSKTVHEVTMPFLYEKLLYEYSREMAASIWKGLPKFRKAADIPSKSTLPRLLVPH
jgi:hypothetical protein